ncbi:hypothetical protein Acid345_1116 [Candidatus Koribacter versatilis Ellin345]|uniref:Uncharacterized protein n=1 Tax=Koribacter versatilis (strain Ellin345) TaxID=204669 RepID=Q1ISN1_KORVE|nr:hypothetical protein [Candidatus Koribacter versatilis]ABF40119.1 hypothetical protein Acid345_1116 [Candidatus Koribacter versatilis Ellin345]
MPASSAKECIHIKADGTTCSAIALRDEDFCYFHVASRDRVRRQRVAAERKLPLQLPVLEDRATVQLAIGDVLNALLCDRIDPRRAALVLYGLQTAAGNIGSLHFTEGNGESFFEYTPEFDAGLPELPESPVLELPKKPAAAAEVAQANQPKTQSR